MNFHFRNDLLTMIADLQSERMNEQRATLPGLVNHRLGSPQNSIYQHNPGTSNVTSALDEGFLDMLMRSQVIILSIKITSYHYDMLTYECLLSRVPV